MNIKQMLAGIFPSVERYVAFINIEEEQVEGEKVPSMGDITLTNVSMCYETNPDKYAIENLSLTIKAGSKTAVIGTNGSGKSTFVNLLLRLYKYSSGSITMNDMEISSLKLDDYRNMFSVVSQDVVLFNGTIKDNLCLYKDFSDSAIKFAIQASGLEGFIKDHTLDYIVGERGTALSGGEKQKLSLARAILHDRPILILDEATANTDIHSKKYIHNYLLNEATEKTVIIITHSDEVLQMMDNIVFLEQGKVLCHGTYVMDVFEVITFDYISKPITVEKLESVLLKAMQYLHMIKRDFVFQFRKNQFRISCDDIVYFEKKGRQAVIHTISENFKANMTTEEIWKQLDDKVFAHIHVSYIREFINGQDDMVEVCVYADISVTGTTFERPEFDRMIQDIRAGKINTVITRDLSRLGRNYVEAGNYIERVFPFLDVRYIAITDDFDTARPGTDLSVPLKNIVNEYYSKDLSKNSE